jgi:YVTN family beta-propeller protein
MKLFAALAAVCLLAGILISQPPPREQVGPRASGGFLLNSGWTLAPAGTQVGVSTFPMASALSKDGRFLIVLNAGVMPTSLSVLDVTTQKEVSRVPVKDGWLGLAFNPKGDRLYVGGGSQASIFEFTYSAGALIPARTFYLIDAAKRTWRDFTGDLAFSPDGRLLYAADLYRDSLLVINPLSGVVIDRIKTGRRPYRILFHPDGKSFFVSSWADGTVTQHQASDGSLLDTQRIGPHPTDMVWRRTETGNTLFVAAANTNSVYSVNVPANGESTRGATVSIALTASQPLGMTPSALALSPDGKKLYVVCSDANAVAQIDLSQEQMFLSGFIPVGWYPTGARVLPDGRLLVLNGRGGRSFPNPKGPNPTKAVERAHMANDPAEYQYVGYIQTGTVSFIDSEPDQLLKYTDTVISNAAYKDAKLEAKPALPAGIHHVIFVVKENRTYDQVLGDMHEGNGDASLVLFGENVTPNLHKLAREFVLLDNFYVNADVSADGHNWSTAAIASDYIQKLWPANYGQRREHYDFEGGEPAALPPAGYLWSNATLAGVSMRNYGYFVENTKNPASPDGIQVQSVRDPQLKPVTDMRYRGFDLDYTDVDRAKEFIRELSAYEQTGKYPALSFVRLGNDHTSGLAAGKIAPLSAAADNDLAVGMMIEALSKTRFWADTAVFIVEDDAQNGPDHVDSHRSPAFVISPLVRRHQVDSTMYNTTSVLRTMELFLGMRPMTQFDAGARVMTSVFQAMPDTTPFVAEQPRTSLTSRNPAKTGADTARLDLRDADLNDDDEMNTQLWNAIKGRKTPTVASGKRPAVSE